MSSWFLFLFLVHCCSGEFLQCLVGDCLTLVSSKKCSKASKGSLVHVVSNGSPREVAALVSGHWTPKPGYDDRLTPGGEAVVLENAVFNDNGLYELSCNNMGQTVIIQVEVLVPFEVSVDSGQSTKLQCHFQIERKAVQSVRWDRGTELVYKQNLVSGEKVFGQSFEGRVEMSPDAQRTGDMSLTLSSVQPQDQGDFYCKVQLKEDLENGHPAAVRLWVKEKRLYTSTCSCPQMSTCSHWIIIITTPHLFFFIAYALVWAVYKVELCRGQKSK